MFGIANFENYFLAILSLLIGFVVAFIIDKLIFKPILKKIGDTNLKVTPILVRGFSKPLVYLAITIGVYYFVDFMPWPATIASQVNTIFYKVFRVDIILLICIGLWNSSPICTLILGGAKNKFDLSASKTVISVLEKVFRALILIFGVLTAMNEFGFNIASLITGLGLVGLTVSLAAQDSASNLFSGLVILLEHPFGIGDWIIVGDVEGTVEDINFRSTRVRALDNSLYIIPNSSVSGAVVNNATNRKKRMYRFTLGVTYSTRKTQLEALMAGIETMLKSQPDVESSTVLVKLLGFGDSSIDILVSAYVFEVDLNRFLAVQNRLNLLLMDVMQEHNCDFAFPSTSVYMEKNDNKQ